MNEHLNNYNILDTFDENQYQKVLMATDKTQDDAVVIINQLKNSDVVTMDVMTHYKSFAYNLVASFEEDGQITLINSYVQSKLLTDFLAGELPNFDLRLNIAKQYLEGISVMSDIPFPLMNILINEDQLTIKDQQLIFSNYIFLKSYDDKTTLKDVHSCIGKTLEVILQLHRETLNSRLTKLQSLIYKLHNGSMDWSLIDILAEYLEALTYILEKDEEIIIEEETTVKEETTVEEETTVKEETTIEEKTAVEEETTVEEETAIQLDVQEKKEPTNHETAVQEILHRDNKQHSDMYIQHEKQKRRFVPTFLLFFIILVIITSLLIFYSSTYM